MRVKRRKLRRSLGVSTVVANMLMIAITLSLAAILVAWAGTTYGAFSGGSQVFFVQRGHALQERFVVEYVTFTKSSNTITIFVRNVGAEEINVVAVYVNGTQYGCTESDCSNTNGLNPPLSECYASQVLGGVWAVTMGVGSVCQFNLTWDSAWSSGGIFNIVVATTRGNQATINMRGP